MGALAKRNGHSGCCGSIMHDDEQPSLLNVFPSSHSSRPCTTLLPQIASLASVRQKTNQSRAEVNKTLGASLGAMASRCTVHAEVHNVGLGG
eukprot:1694030-Rhodomonas_salina.2